MAHIAFLMSDYDADTAMHTAVGETAEDATAAVVAKQVAAYAAMAEDDDPAAAVQEDLDSGALWVITGVL